MLPSRASSDVVSPSPIPLALALLAVLLAARVAFVWRRGRSRRPAGDPPLRTLVVLGSGGHTAEMLVLLRALPPEAYAPLLYTMAASDTTSAAKVAAFDAERARRCGSKALLPSEMLRVPRSREVGQSYVTSVATTLRALIASLLLVWRARPDLLLCNGPGTCVPLCAAAWSLRLAGVKHVEVAFVESFCRVESLSLSGRILMAAARASLRGALALPPTTASHRPRAHARGRRGSGSANTFWCSGRSWPRGTRAQGTSGASAETDSIFLEALNLI